jgi:hypothetical protein
VAATAAAAFGRPMPVRADAEVVHVGDDIQTAETRTRILNETNDADVFAAQTTGNGTALIGISETSTGIAGTSSYGTGVYAASIAGKGLQVSSTDNVAIEASSYRGNVIHAVQGPAGGAALWAEGRLVLSQAGIAIIPTGQKTWTSVPDNKTFIGTASFVLLTPNADIGTRRLWFTKNLIANTITIHMSATRTKPTKVAWMLLN